MNLRALFSCFCALYVCTTCFADDIKNKTDNEIATEALGDHYFLEATKCFEENDHICALSALELMWHLDLTRERHFPMWTHMAAKSNLHMALVPHKLKSVERRIEIALRSERLFSVFQGQYLYERYLALYFVLKESSDPCEKDFLTAREKFEFISEQQDNRIAADDSLHNIRDYGNRRLKNLGECTAK